MSLSHPSPLQLSPATSMDSAAECGSPAGSVSTECASDDDDLSPTARTERWVLTTHVHIHGSGGAPFEESKDSEACYSSRRGSRGTLRPATGGDSPGAGPPCPQVGCRCALEHCVGRPRILSAYDGAEDEDDACGWSASLVRCRAGRCNAGGASSSSAAGRRSLSSICWADGLPAAAATAPQPITPWQQLPTAWGASAAWEASSGIEVPAVAATAVYPAAPPSSSKGYSSITQQRAQQLPHHPEVPQQPQEQQPQHSCPVYVAAVTPTTSLQPSANATAAAAAVAATSEAHGLQQQQPLAWSDIPQPMAAALRRMVADTVFSHLFGADDDDDDDVDGSIAGHLARGIAVC